MQCLILPITSHFVHLLIKSIIVNHVSLKKVACEQALRGALGPSPRVKKSPKRLLAGHFKMVFLC